LGITNRAENGCFLHFSDDNGKWHALLRDGASNTSWRKNVLEILDYYTDRTPGSFIENNEITFSWDYGFADPVFGSWQAAEMQNHLIKLMLKLFRKMSAKQ
jgi:trehalose 6-phosphate synthase/phosphatase